MDPIQPLNRLITQESPKASISRDPITQAIVDLVLDNKIGEAVKKTETIKDIYILKSTIKALVCVSKTFDKQKQSEFLATVALGTVRVKGLEKEALNIASKIPLSLTKEKTTRQIMLLITAPKTRHETNPRIIGLGMSNIVKSYIYNHDVTQAESLASQIACDDIRDAAFEYISAHLIRSPGGEERGIKNANKIKDENKRADMLFNCAKAIVGSLNQDLLLTRIMTDVFNLSGQDDIGCRISNLFTTEASRSNSLSRLILDKVDTISDIEWGLSLSNIIDPAHGRTLVRVMLVSSSFCFDVDRAIPIVLKFESVSDKDIALETICLKLLESTGQDSRIIELAQIISDTEKKSEILEAIKSRSLLDASNDVVLSKMTKSDKIIKTISRSVRARLNVVMPLCMGIFDRSPAAFKEFDLKLEGSNHLKSVSILKEFLRDYKYYIPDHLKSLMDPIIDNKIANLTSEREFCMRLQNKSVDLTTEGALLKKDVLNCLDEGSEFSRIIGYRRPNPGRGHATHLSVKPFGEAGVNIVLIDPIRKGSFSCFVLKELFLSDASDSFFENMLRPTVCSLGETYYENEGGKAGITLIKESLETLSGYFKDDSFRGDSKKMAGGYCLWRSIIQGMDLSFKDIAPSGFRHFELYLKRTVLALLDTTAKLALEEPVLDGKPRCPVDSKFLGLYVRLPQFF